MFYLCIISCARGYCNKRSSEFLQSLFLLFILFCILIVSRYCFHHFSLIGCVIFSDFKISFNSSSFNRPSSNTSSFTEIPVFSDFFAISADFAYPIYGHNAVEIPTLFQYILRTVRLRLHRDRIVMSNDQVCNL